MERTLNLYFTSDTHGHIFPVNYATNEPSNSGLLNLANQIQKDGNTLVLDGGDSLQGTPLTQYYLKSRDQWSTHPVAAAFNAMQLDYFTLGNHDFNFGYEVLRDYLRAMNGVCLCANVEDLKGELAFQPYAIHTLENGLRIGITGIVTDFVNVWEQPQNLEYLRISDTFTCIQQVYTELKPQCDICICIYHGGFEEDLESGRLLSSSKENVACKIARELGFDLLLTGHQHMPVESVNLFGTHAVQPPANAGQYLYIEGSVENSSVQFHSTLKPVGSIHSDEPFQTLLPLENAVQNWLDQPIGALEKNILPESKLDVALHGSQVAALFNQVQLEATGADFSCTSLGNDPIGLPSPVTIRAVTAAYLFSNTLVVLEVTAEIIKKCLERCASYYTLVNGEPQISKEFLLPKVEHYNYDLFSGLRFTFDLRKPVGNRVVELKKLDGTPLGDGTYRLCTSNYRATGTGGYEFLRDCPVLFRGQDEVPDLVVQYIEHHASIPELHNVSMQLIW